MLAQKYDRRNVDFEAISATVRASWSRGTSVVATEQMLAQQHVWRRSQLAALSAANLTGYISYTSSTKKQAKKTFHGCSLWNDLKTLWCWNKYLCQRVSIKNLDTTARLQRSRRVCEIPLGAGLISTIKQTHKPWMFLSYFTPSRPSSSIPNKLRLIRKQPFRLK